MKDTLIPNSLARVIKPLFVMIAVVSLLGCAQSKRKVNESVKSETPQVLKLDDEGIRNYIDSLLTATNGVSIAVAVGHGEDIIYQTQRGYENLDDSTRVDESSLYRIGSTSKVLASTLLFRYIENGTVSLDDPIQKYVSEFPKKGHEITVRHILTHTSGIRHYNGYKPQDQARHTTNFKTFSEAISIFKNDTLLFVPGTKWHYTSYGFNLIQGILENVSGRNIEELMKDELFTPIGMHSSFVEVYGDRPKDLIQSYSWEQREQRIIPARPGNPSYKKVAGGMVSRASDLVRFLMATGNHEVVNKNTFQLMMQVPYPEIAAWQAYGWRYGKRSDGTVVYHHGGVSRGFISLVIMIPETEIYVAVLANYDQFNDVRSDLAYHLIDLVNQTLDG